MTKTELENLIKEAHRVEEDAIALITRHVEAAVEWFPGSPEEKSHINAVLDQLFRDSARHSKILNELLARMETEARDVY